MGLIKEDSEKDTEKDENDIDIPLLLLGFEGSFCSGFKVSGTDTNAVTLETESGERLQSTDCGVGCRRDTISVFFVFLFEKIKCYIRQN